MGHAAVLSLRTPWVELRRNQEQREATGSKQGTARLMMMVSWLVYPPGSHKGDAPGGEPAPWLDLLYPPPRARGPGASAPTAGQGLWLLVFAGACQGTAWAGLCLIHHHHHGIGSTDLFLIPRDFIGTEVRHSTWGVSPQPPCQVTGGVAKRRGAVSGCWRALAKGTAWAGCFIVQFTIIICEEGRLRIMCGCRRCACVFVDMLVVVRLVVDVDDRLALEDVKDHVEALGLGGRPARRSLRGRSRRRGGKRVFRILFWTKRILSCDDGAERISCSWKERDVFY